MMIKVTGNNLQDRKRGGNGVVSSLYQYRYLDRCMYLK